MHVSHILLGLTEFALVNAGKGAYSPADSPSPTPSYLGSPPSYPSQPPSWPSGAPSWTSQAPWPSPVKSWSSEAPSWPAASWPTPSKHDTDTCDESTVYVHDTVTVTSNVTEFAWKTYYVENTTTIVIEKPKTVVVYNNATLTQHDTQTRYNTVSLPGSLSYTTRTYTLPGSNYTTTRVSTVTLPGQVYTLPLTINQTATTGTTQTVLATATVTAPPQTVTVCPTTSFAPSSTCVSSCVIDLTATLLQYPTAVVEHSNYYAESVIDVYVTVMDDGSMSSSSSLVSVLDTTLHVPITWTEPMFPGVTFTYPTTYIAYTTFTYDYKHTTTTICHSKAGPLELPQPTDWRPLVYPIQSVSTPDLPPSALVTYLNGLTTVTQQLEGQTIGDACDPAHGKTSSVNEPTGVTVTYTRAIPTPSTRTVIPVGEQASTALAQSTLVAPTVTVTGPPPPPPPPTTSTSIIIVTPTVVVPPPAPPPSSTTVLSTFSVVTTNAAAPTAGPFAKAGAIVAGAMGLGLGFL